MGRALSSSDLSSDVLKNIDNQEDLQTFIEETWQNEVEVTSQDGEENEAATSAIHILSARKEANGNASFWRHPLLSETGR